MATTTDAPTLLLGPMLRHVGETSATIWVETDRPCAVRVCAGTGAGTVEVTERTWGVHGHHFAVLVLEGLSQGSTTPYSVTLSTPDGTDQVWPPTGPGWPPEWEQYPPSVIRTSDPGAPFRLAFGSCRRSEPLDAEGNAAVGPDAMVAMADRIRTDPTAPWPDLLLMVGDQLYADEPSKGVVERLQHSQRDAAESGSKEVRTEICTFEEYTWLYHESWQQVPVRWLLSTVPSCMLLDDHDLRDDWNTSAAWRAEFQTEPWFPDRVKGALGSYWVYQHLGNVPPDQLAGDPLLAAIKAADDDEARSQLLDDFAVQADDDPDSARWSYVRDFGVPGHAVRLVAVDNRCSRELDPRKRAILDEVEWDWVREHAVPADVGAQVDHLLIACTLPVLMIPAFSDIEGWNEAVVAGAWGRPLSGLAERLRRAIDLEHWAAFRRSLDDMITLLRDVASGAQAPASILVLSGDVHCSYLSRAQLDGADHAGTAVHQLVMSPFRNPLKPALRLANRIAQWSPVVAFCRALAASAGVARPKATWGVDAGPWFDNGVMTVVLEGREATVEVDHARLDDDGRLLRRTTVRQLTP